MLHLVCQTEEASDPVLGLRPTSDLLLNAWNWLLAELLFSRGCQGSGTRVWSLEMAQGDATRRRKERERERGISLTFVRMLCSLSLSYDGHDGTLEMKTSPSGLQTLTA